MADQTSSSIVVDATPGQVMAVIADFDAYPVWAKGVKKAQVLSTLPEARERVYARLYPDLAKRKRRKRKTSKAKPR